MGHTDADRELLLALGVVGEVDLFQRVHEHIRHLQQVLTHWVACVRDVERYLLLVGIASLQGLNLLLLLLVLMLELVEHVRSELVVGILHQQGVEDDAVLKELLLLGVLLEIEATRDEDFIQVPERFLVQRLLKVKDEGEEDIRGPEPRRVERAERDLMHLVEVGLCQSDKGR